MAQCTAVRSHVYRYARAQVSDIRRIGRLSAVSQVHEFGLTMEVPGEPLRLLRQYCFMA